MIPRQEWEFTKSWGGRGVSGSDNGGREETRREWETHTSESPQARVRALACLLQHPCPSVTRCKALPGTLPPFCFCIFQDKRKPSTGEWCLPRETETSECDECVNLLCVTVISCNTGHLLKRFVQLMFRDWIPISGGLVCLACDKLFLPPHPYCYITM